MKWLALLLSLLVSGVHAQTYYGPTFSPSQLYVNSFGPSTGTQASTFDHHQIFCANENFAITGGASVAANCLEIFYGFGGNNTSNARNGLIVTTQLQSQPTATNPFYAGGNFIGQALATAGGTGTTSGTALGAMEGLLAFAQLASGATNYASVVGVESTVQILTGGSSLARHGIALVSQGNLQAAVNGAVQEDAAIHIGSGGAGTTQWHSGMNLSHFNGLAPLDTGGCVICTDSSADTIATGIDLHTYTISGNALSFANFTVTGAGATKVGVTTVGSLPTCNSGAQGSHMFVTNSNATSFTSGIGAVVAAGGTTAVPVTCDGTNWRIG